MEGIPAFPALPGILSFMAFLAYSFFPRGFKRPKPGTVRMYRILAAASLVLFLLKGGYLRFYSVKVAAIRLAKMREAEQLKRLEWRRTIKPIKTWAVGVGQETPKVEIIPGMTPTNSCEVLIHDSIRMGYFVESFHRRQSWKHNKSWD